MNCKNLTVEDRKERHRTRARAYYHANKVQVKLRAKIAYLKWYASNRDIIRERTNLYRQKRHGLPIPTRPRPEACEACGRFGVEGRRLALDHDHKTGEFRGWLCGPCNRGLGLLGDSIAGVEALHAYLLR